MRIVWWRAVAAMFVVLVAIVAGVLAFEPPRDALARTALSAYLWSKGFRLVHMDLRTGSGRLRASAVAIDGRDGEPFASADSISVDYGVRGRLFGISAVDVERPTIAIHREQDGSFDISRLFGGGSGSNESAPLYARITVRNGSVTVINQWAAAPSGRLLRVRDINAGALVHQGAITDAWARATLDGASAPIAARFHEDDRLRFARAVVEAMGVPLAASVNLVVSNPAFVIERGTADARVQAYALDWPAGGSPAWHLTGSGTLRDGVFRVVPLATPLEAVNGPFRVGDGTFYFPSLRAFAAHLPVAASGTLQILPAPSLDFQVAAKGSLERAKNLLAESKQMPLHGPVFVAATIRGPVQSPHAVVALESQEPIRYAGVVLDSLRARADYAQGHVEIRDAVARYDGIAIYGDGDIDIGAPSPVGQFVAFVNAPSRNLPWIGNLESSGVTRVAAAMNGPLAHIVGAGFASATGGRAPLRAVLNVDDGGVAGLAIGDDRSGGSIFAGGELDRTSARRLTADLQMRDFALRLDRRSVTLPGISARPMLLPAASGRFNGYAALRGTVDSPASAVLMSASSVRVAGTDLGRLSVNGAGAGGRITLREAALTGANGRIRASGTIGLAPGTGVDGALRGSASGDLSTIARVAGDAGIAVAASGWIDSSFSVAFWPQGFLGASNLHGSRASVEGISLGDVAAVVGGSPKQLTVYSGQGDVAGGRVLLAGELPGASRGSLLVLARGISASQLVAGRSPISQGTVDALATVRGTASDPNVDGAAILQGGVVAGAPLRGDAQLHYARGSLTVIGARVSSDDSQIDIDGDVSHVLGGDPALALNASMPVGNLATLSQLPRSALPLSGIASANGSIGGDLSSPRIAGDVAVGTGTVRGVTFDDLHAQLAAAPGYVDVRSAHVRFGSSSIDAAGDLSGSDATLRASSSRVDLDDFNDFFDGADVLEGVGAFDVSLTSTGKWEQAAGAVRFHDVAYSMVPVGTVTASMQPAGDATRARIAQSGPLATSAIQATVIAASGSMPAIHAKGSLRDVDLGATAERFGDRYGIGGNGRADFSADGPLNRLGGQANFEVDGARISGIDLQGLSGTVAATSGSYALRRFDASIAGGTLHATGMLDRSGRIVADGTLVVDDLSAFGESLHVPYAMNGSGSVSADAAGSIDKPRVQVALRASRGSIDDVAFDTVVANAAYAANRATAQASVNLAKQGGDVQLRAALPVQLRPFGIGPNDGAVMVDVRASQAAVAVVNPFLRGKVVLGGTLDAETRVAGTVGRPTLSGVAHVRNGFVRSRYDSVPLSNLSADVAFENDSVTLSGAHATVGRGTLDLHGEGHVVPAVGLRKTPSLQYAFDTALHDGDVDVPDLVKGTVNAQMSLTKSGSIPYLSGDIDLANTSVPFAGILELASSAGGMGQSKTTVVPGLPVLQPHHVVVYGGSLFGDDLEHIVRPTPRPTAPPAAQAALAVLPPKLNLGLHVSAGKNVGVTGLIDVSGTGMVDVSGDTNSPQLRGTLTAVRGRAGILNTQFNLLDGYLSFRPQDGFLPTVAADASTSTDQADITVSVSGRVDNLHTVFDSDPEMSQDAIVASLLHVPQINSALAASHGEQQAALGVSPQNLASGVIAGQLFGALNSGLEQVFNLEEVDFGIDPYGNPSLELRKQVSPRAYTLYRTTFTVPASQAFGIAYSVRRALQIELTQTQGAPGPSNPLGSPYTTSVQVKITFH